MNTDQQCTINNNRLQKNKKYIKNLKLEIMIQYDYNCK